MVALRRSVEVVPFSVIATLAARRALPLLPPWVEALGRTAAFRAPTLAECERLTWLLCLPPSWAESQRVLGVGSYLDRYCYTSSSDVREISTVQGTPRACIELVRFMRDGARACGRRVLGEVCEGNAAMKAAMEKMGGRPTRVVYEDAP